MENLPTSTPEDQSPTPQPPSTPEPISQKFLKVFGTVVILFGLVGSAGIYFRQRIDNAPKSFDECIKRTGSRLQESYPSVCITREGNYFIQEVYKPAVDPQLQNPSGAVVTPVDTIDPNQQLTPFPTYTNTTLCKRAGCSGQLCVEMYAEDDTFSTCEYKPEYTCLQEAPCERQTDGTCGFTPSVGLTACLEDVKNTNIEQPPRSFAQ